MTKILIIGQAPPAIKQDAPYDTTLLYEILSWVGITKEQAIGMFEFEAMTDKFPGFSKNGHALPTTEEMQSHYENTLKYKIEGSSMVLLFGKCAINFFLPNTPFFTISGKFVTLPHPSKRNYNLIHSNKQKYIDILHSLNHTSIWQRL